MAVWIVGFSRVEFRHKGAKGKHQLSELGILRGANLFRQG